MSAITGPVEVMEPLAQDGVRTVADVLERSECVRDLKDRSNHVLEAGGMRIFVKRVKKSRTPREADAIRVLQAARVPTAELAFRGVDAELGAVTGTRDLSPARPLDDLLRSEALSRRDVRRALVALADVVGTLHNAGLNHRELYLCHVFVRVDTAIPHIAFIDVERVRKHNRTLGRRVLKDLAALASSIPENTTQLRERALFLVRYLRRRGIPRRGVYEGLVRRIRRKARRIQRHAPRTPVGDAARPGGGA